MAFGKKKTGTGETPGITEVMILSVIVILYVFYAGPFLNSLSGKWASSLFTAGFGLLPVLYIAGSGYRFTEVFQIRPPAGKAVVGGLLLAAGMFLLTLIGTTWASSVFPGMRETEEMFFALIKGKNLGFIILSIAVLPAVCEEILFRGFILSGLKKEVTKKSSVVLSGFLFSLIHLDLYRLPFTFAIGIGLSWAAWESRSIFVPVIMHGAHNMVMLFMMLYGSAGFADEFQRLSWPKAFCIVIIGGLFVLFGIGVLKTGKIGKET